MAKRILLSLLVAATGFAAEVVPFLEVNGVPYRDVKFGPVNQDKVVLFHSLGVVSIPIASLPAEYQQRVAAPDTSNGLPVPQELKLPASGPKPVTPAPLPVQPDQPTILEAMRAKRAESANNSGGGGDWATYTRERGSLVVIEGKLVEKSTLTPLIGFLAKERVQLSDGKRTYNGALLDLAVRKSGGPAVAESMELRPSLWRRTDERVFLVNFKPLTITGALMKVYVVEASPIDQWRAYKAGNDPSFEDWKRLPRR